MRYFSQFFLKATQLEQMKRDYNSANESKEIALEILKQKKQVGQAINIEKLFIRRKSKIKSGTV